MPFGFDQILPSLQSLGIWSYWIIGLASALEAFFITGIVLPGTLVVDAGGILVERGLLDYFDLVWFVAIGSFVGGELSYRVGILGARGLRGRVNLETSLHYKRAERLFARHGGLALVIGRFLGPVAGLVSFAAAISGMEHRRFAVWNLIGAFPYALAHVALGYFLGNTLFKMGPFATRVALFAIGVSLALILLWYLVVRIERMLPFVLSVLKSIIGAAAENPNLRAWGVRHPRLAGFLAHRLDTDSFLGLTATLLGAVFFYFLFIWAGTVSDFLMAEPIVQIDTRLANLIHAFWSPRLLRIFTHVTAVGDGRVVAVTFAGVMIALLLRRRVALVLGLTVTVFGNVASVAALKAIFDRPRPELAYFVETSGSFPSGHAAISVAFYGMFFYIAWRLRLLGPISAAILAVTVAFLIGLSRLFLIEHYLSDVLNGYLVGTVWLVTGIALAEWWHETHAPRAMPTPGTAARSRVLAPALVLGIAFAGAGWMNITYDKARSIEPPASATEIVSDIPAIFTTGRAQPTTESITGSPLEPVNLILVTKDAAAFEAAMKRAGWVKDEKPGVASLARAVWASWTNQEDNTTLIAPFYWAGQPNDFGFQKPTPDQTQPRRHHARFWNTRFLTPDGARIFIGTASLDNGLDWGVIHHIDPNFDAERDALIADLKATGMTQRDQPFTLPAPRLDRDAARNPWSTDGKAVIVWMK